MYDERQPLAKLVSVLVRRCLRLMYTREHFDDSHVQKQITRIVMKEFICYWITFVPACVCRGACLGHNLEGGLPN